MLLSWISFRLGNLGILKRLRSKIELVIARLLTNTNTEGQHTVHPDLQRILSAVRRKT